jgi:pantoate--beta-alanine ligase
MGYLHDGHCSLIRKAKQEHDIVVVSIFVNPSQFAPHEDFERYPRDLERDSRLAREAGCEILFTPETTTMYPTGFSSTVSVDRITAVLEGKFRPSHFAGVTTVVAKLFNIVQPDTAYFGQKDVQQCVVIRKMTDDLNIPVRITILPTVRESDGLAMSSRNVYLSEDERRRATVLYESLRHSELMIAQGERSPDRIMQTMTGMIRSKEPTQIDYIEIVDANGLQPKTELTNGDVIVIAAAVRFGATRLIDNTIVTIQ